MHRVHAVIDLAALERNLGRIRAALPPHIRYISVVKADAYGHGLKPMATRLMQSGADAFAVANVQEAAELRELGHGWPLLVLGPVLPKEYSLLFTHKLIPTLSSKEEIDTLEAFARAWKQSLLVHLKIDTGMGRTGVWHEEACALYQHLRTCKALNLHGLYTHFSSADSDLDYTALQRGRFLEVLRKCDNLDVSKLWIHADNSAGLESFSETGPFNAVRVGLLQFGLPPHAGSLLKSLRTEPVLRFEARICLVKNLPKGTSISYGRTHRLERNSQVAVLGAGYADGIPRHLSNRGQVLLHGQRCPILGRVTMDQTIIDVTDIPRVRVGDLATLLGIQGETCITAVEFAQWAESIPWEVFCSIGKRVPRLYRTDRPAS